MMQLRRATAQFGLVLLSMLLSACGGGGGSSPAPGGATPQPPPPPPASSAPYIEGSVASFPILGVPPTLLVLRDNDFGNAVAAVVVRDPSSQAPIATATVDVNGTALPYVAASQQYQGRLKVHGGDKVTLTVTVGAATYTASGTQFTSYPRLRSPVNNTAWDAGQANTITWTGQLPRPDARYAVALLDDDRLAWPSTYGVRILPAGPARSYTFAPNTLSDQLDNVMAGVVDVLPVANAAAGSQFVVGGFTQAPLWVTVAGHRPLESMVLTPDLRTVAVGGSLQLVVTGIYPAANNQDLTSRAVWTSSAPAVLSVGPTGLVTGNGAGSATVTATSGAVSASAEVTVYRKTVSPAPAVSQAVAFQVGPDHAGRASFGAPLAFPDKPTWSMTLPGRASYPLIAGGKVFVLAEDPRDGAPYRHVLLALDRDTGALRWGPLAFDTVAGQAYDQGKLFVVDVRGVLKSYDADTGAPGWTTQLPGEWHVMSPPTAANGIVYVSGAGQHDGVVHAVDQASGKALWKAEVEGSHSSPAVTSDGVFVTFIGETYKLDPVSGEYLWRAAGKYFGGGARAPAVANGKVYARDPDGTRRVFDAASGEQTGTFQADQVPAFTAQTGFFVSGGVLKAIELASGRTLWTHAGPVVTAPIVIDNVVVVGAATGEVIALDGASGARVWSGIAGAVIEAPDEHNAFILTGMSAGEGVLVVPARNILTAWKLTGP